MTVRKPLYLAVGLLLAVAGLLPAGAVSRAATLDVVWEPQMLPVVIEGKSYRLETLVAHARDGMRHPLMVINHGAPRSVEEFAKTRASGYQQQMLEFVRRGWTVAAIVRRGFGHSDGQPASSGKCGHRDYLDTGLEEARDIAAAIKALGAFPSVDPSKIVVVGQSAGGFATVAMSANPPPGVVAAINFAGGRGSTAPDQVCDVERLMDAFTQFGKTSRLPELWIYTENDHYFSPVLSRRFHEAFTAGGGQAAYRLMPAFGEDGHLLFSQHPGMPIWEPIVDRFLAEHGLALRDRPLDLPPTAIGQSRGMSREKEQSLQEYAALPPHKALAMSPSGSYGWVTGRDDAGKAQEDALKNCDKNGRNCKIVDIDGR